MDEDDGETDTAAYLLDPDTPEEAVEADLRMMGLDPVELGKRGASFARQIREQRRATMAMQLYGLAALLFTLALTRPEWAAVPEETAISDDEAWWLEFATCPACGVVGGLYPCETLAGAPEPS